MCASEISTSQVADNPTNIQHLQALLSASSTPNIVHWADNIHLYSPRKKFHYFHILPLYILSETFLWSCLHPK